MVPGEDHYTVGADVFLTHMKANVIIYKEKYLELHRAEGYYPEGIEGEYMADPRVAEIVGRFRG